MYYLFLHASAAAYICMCVLKHVLYILSCEMELLQLYPSLAPSQAIYLWAIYIVQGSCS